MPNSGLAMQDQQYPMSRVLRYAWMNSYLSSQRFCFTISMATVHEVTGRSGHVRQDPVGI